MRERDIPEHANTPFEHDIKYGSQQPLASSRAAFEDLSILPCSKLFKLYTYQHFWRHVRT